MARSKVPITLLTGFLGAGKTTLLNRWLSEAGQKGLRLGVLVNEFGGVGIDGALLSNESQPGRVIELSNGCVCCVMSGELQKSLFELAQSYPDLDHIVIETSGASDPTSVLKLLWGAPEITDHHSLNSVVTVVDAQNFSKTRAEPVCSLQIQVADCLFISKSDSAGPEATRALEAELRALSPLAEVLLSLLLEKAMGLRSYQSKAVAKSLEKWPMAVDVAHAGLASFAWEWNGEIDPERLRGFFRALVRDIPNENLLRIKGLLKVAGSEKHWLVQGVQGWIEKDFAPKNYQGSNRLVILGRNLDSDALNALLLELGYSKKTSPENTL